MSTVLYLLNAASVGLFGVILSASFCDIEWTRHRRVTLAVSTVLMLALQAFFYVRWNGLAVKYAYPFITHLPLFLVLFALTGKGIWSLVAVLTAYLCCQLRRWIALLVIVLFNGGSMMQDATEFLVTIPLTVFLLRYVSPSVRDISHSTISLQLQFGLLPLLGYGFDYLTRIYTNLLSSGNVAAVEFMPFVCSAAYLAFVLRTTQEERLRSQLEQTRNSLDLQVSQAMREIDALRESQHKASTYRHDMRHHLQYILACIENDRLPQAEDYIRSVCAEIEASKVTVYCENETLNLILSSFAARAQADAIDFRVRAAIPSVLSLPESDLCVLMSNALENALHACQREKAAGKTAFIEVSAYQQDGQFFLQIANTCTVPVAFEQDVPVTRKAGHGIGVRSICAIVDKYGGMYSFFTQPGQFVLRISL